MRLRNHGDTIVEVLVALTVTSALIGGAYATTNKSLTGARASQERSEALKIAETQAERLRSLANPVNAPAKFCLDPSAAPIPTSAAASASAENDASLSSYAPTCVQGLYHISITHPASASTSANTFNIKVRWQRVDGTRVEELPITYTVF